MRKLIARTIFVLQRMLMMSVQAFDLSRLKSKFKNRSDLHLARKIWHMGGVSIMAAVYAYLPREQFLIGISILWALFVPFDFLRLRIPKLNHLMLSGFNLIMRENEVNKIAGTTYLISGLVVVVLVFSPPIVLLTMLFLAFADPIASFFGIKYGKDKIIGNKSFQGTLAAFVVCSILTFMYLSHEWLMVDHIVVISLIGGLIGALAELIPIGKLDDNFTLPIISASGLWALFSYFQTISGYVQ